MEPDISLWLLADDPWNTDSLISWEDSNDFDPDDDWWGGCSCCAMLTRSFYVADQQADDLFAADFDNESYMNAAGRTTMHPYRDLRSASYARKRSSKKAKSRPRTQSVGGRKWEHAQCRRENKRKKRDTLRYEIYENQRRDRVCWCSPGKQKNLDIVVWDVNLEEEFDQELVAEWSHYEKFHKNAGEFESPEPYKETDEAFSVWAQRRIAEMRAVKESRMQTQVAPRQQPMVYKTNHYRPMRIGVDIFSYNIYCGSPLTTTQPTNAYDAYGHTLLRAALTPSRWARKRTRFDPKISLFPRIYNYSWFGEYTWRWHRNASGCWQIGYGECDGCAIPFPCSNTGGYLSNFDKCYCEEFEGEVAPEEQQRCSLVEWVGAEGRRLIRADEARAQANGHTRDCDNDFAGDSDSEWSFVDEYCGVRSCSSVASSIELSDGTCP
ncbi:hypothetical protein P171DRAFT_437872 [Karstenula rhodostoma CBS 690.94]|uniref:Uncharacterized protein n=1 Tax=Karstenula rhodostoma CBS 690.94 TaxID=1392251 RepID=A0A9P4P4G7_9PLEO|nr:hypothetical protein P171DRAFT_437872 [Karstenula rhodostoma CBS 690.94]